MTIGPIAFLVPWILAALVVLPVLWWLLRAIPPSPLRRVFPGVRLLLGLQQKEVMPARTPWWLLALRIGALAAAILAFAQPVLNPREETGSGPLLVLLDGGWGDAPDWSARMSHVAGALNLARQDSRPAALLQLSDTPPAEPVLEMRSAADWADRLQGLTPAPWGPDRESWAAWFEELDAGFETLWLTDGVSDDGEARLADALLSHGPVTVVPPAGGVRALTPPRLEEGVLRVSALQAEALPGPVSVAAIGPDPNGIERVLGRGESEFASGSNRVDISIPMPVELRNRVSRIQLETGLSAAGVVLADDAVRRRKVGLLSGQASNEAQDLTDPLNYLRKALEPFAEVVEAPLNDMLNTAPDVLILADVGSVSAQEEQDLLDWLGEGGVLIRFAGPRLARSGEGQLERDPLLPVRLRAGGRSVGGAMSWGAPRKLRPFPEDGVFAGLPIPGDVDISAQVMAQPDPDLSQRVLAALEDGTPLVTGREEGDGLVVLFHVTASADWSNLPLSGLFVQMLERLTQSAGSRSIDEGAVEGLTWTPAQVLDGFGRLQQPTLVAGVPGEDLIGRNLSAEVPPGIYASGDQRVVLNVMGPDAELAPLAGLPDGVTFAAMEQEGETRLAPWFLAAAVLMLAIDVLATLMVSGRFRNVLRTGRRAAAGIAVLALLAVSVPAEAQEVLKDPAPTDPEVLYAANETVLAYVLTGNDRIDRISEAGLRGLSRALFTRTAIEPADPVGVDLETSELSVLPMLYWPVTEYQPDLSDEAYVKLNDYLRYGGLILFDTMDSDLARNFNGETPNGRALQRIALKLDIPPLAPIPEDHVLTRTFYLIQDFPGRWYNTPVWAEAAHDVSEVEGLPFRNLNDGVTPVVIGGNDWASAWAEAEDGRPLFPIGRGTSGARQREMAMRFGVNLVMHVMTGNYKSDQVHVPALLDRLGQ
ncbi:DUF4159 domain-containing protein [Amaricoccus tamworthensis]|uniref:DUF4159 domain-containing protein n=1 Tax=Amaricoccus tamworthensis TaxID=57002 RepID=UPI003C7B7B1B